MTSHVKKTDCLCETFQSKPELTNAERKHLQDLADLFKHLSDPRRLQLLLLLSRHEHSVCVLAKHLGVTVSAVSHQLQTLRRARLVTFRREGKICFYRLLDDHVRALVQLGQEHVQE